MAGADGKEVLADNDLVTPTIEPMNSAIASLPAEGEILQREKQLLQKKFAELNRGLEDFSDREMETADRLEIRSLLRQFTDRYDDWTMPDWKRILAAPYENYTTAIRSLLYCQNRRAETRICARDLLMRVSEAPSYLLGKVAASEGLLHPSLSDPAGQ